jgi:ADP-heptose:LPS heptosyltransferase
MHKVPVFLIKKNNTELIAKIKNEVKEAIFPEENAKYSDPAFVTALATRLNLTISINNGIMHMVSLAYKPMILLFGSGGPREVEKFAPKYSNVKILNSNKMYNTNDISKISENDVLDLVQYIN